MVGASDPLAARHSRTSIARSTAGAGFMGKADPPGSDGSGGARIAHHPHTFTMWRRRDCLIDPVPFAQGRALGRTPDSCNRVNHATNMSSVSMQSAKPARRILTVLLRIG